MINKIITNKYKKIVLRIINNLDPMDKHYGRPCKHNYNKCLDYIIEILTMGLSWKKISYLKKNNVDAIRKRYAKWVKLNVFVKANNVLLNIYKQKYNIKNMFIDSVVIENYTGSLKYGYNIKVKNKKSIKITAVIDSNKIPHILMVSESNHHDAKLLEDIVMFNNFDNANINLVGDKGYIKSENYKQYINNEFNINLITPYRTNSINIVDIDPEIEELLEKRCKVEHFFSILKKSYLKIRLISDKNQDSYYNYLSIASGLMIQEYVN